MTGLPEHYPALSLFDVHKGTLIRTFGHDDLNANSVVFSSDSKMIIVGDDNGLVRFWSAESDVPLSTRDESTSVQSVTLSPDGKVLATAGADGHIRLRDTTDGNLIREFRGHSSGATSIAFSLDGKNLVSDGRDGTTKFWATSSGELLVTLIGFGKDEWISFTPEGYYDASPRTAEGLVKWRSGNSLYEASRYRQKLNRPELVAARLMGPTTPPSLLGVTTSSADAAKAGLTPEAEKNLWSLLPAKKFYALIIGNNKYHHVESLNTPVTDAGAVEKVLRETYGFETTLLLDANRAQILEAINKYKNDLHEDANLLIYYAGHGTFNETLKKAYWWPVDVTAGDTTNWISATDINDNLREMKAIHVLIISDSCYSGELQRRGEIVGTAAPTGGVIKLRQIMHGTSRTLIASGSNEPVNDDEGNGHSVFANALLRGLNEFGPNIFTAYDLFYLGIMPNAAVGKRQTPQYGRLYSAGHDDGDFVFVRKRIQ